LGPACGIGIADARADGDGALFQDLTVAPHGHLGGADLGAMILDVEADGLRLPDDAEARRVDEHHAAVALIPVPGDQHMHGRREAERTCLGRHVMHAPVGDHDRARHPVARHGIAPDHVPF
jgi:hypothetical protein